ncbi:MAG: META domain-containing protein [Planctomycetota bacterium]
MNLTTTLCVAASCIACLCLAGCVSPQVKDGDWDIVASSTWNLTRLDGKAPITSPEGKLQPLSLEFSNDGRAAGFAGVNRYFGSYEATPQGALRFGALGATRMYSDNPPGLMNQEQAFFDALGAIDSYGLQDDHLVLMSEGKKLLLFEPSPEQPTATPE